MNKQILNRCLNLALEGKMTFPESLRQMIQTGVERYRADLIALEKNHYAANGETHREPIPLSNAPAIGDVFSADLVKAALIDIQQRRIHYPEFLRRIMSAGATEYSVFISGKKAIYTGRRGDFHVEHFPGAN